MGIGLASGENSAVEAAKAAIYSPLLETSIQGAKGVLINITCGSDLSLFEINEAADAVAEAADPEANIIFGAAIDESFKEQTRVTVIATGFDKREPHGIIRGEEASHTDDKNPIETDIDIPAYLRKRRSGK